jgi:hypothetical protein
MNRNVLSLEAAGQMRVPESDYSHVVHPTEPSQFAASIGRPTSALVIGFMGRVFIANDLRHSEVQC